MQIIKRRKRDQKSEKRNVHIADRHAHEQRERRDEEKGHEKREKQGHIIGHWERIFMQSPRLPKYPIKRHGKQCDHKRVKNVRQKMRKTKHCVRIAVAFGELIFRVRAENERRQKRHQEARKLLRRLVPKAKGIMSLHKDKHEIKCGKCPEDPKLPRRVIDGKPHDF